MLSQAFLSRKAAHSSCMFYCCHRALTVAEMKGQQSWTQSWRVLLGYGRNVFASVFTHKGVGWFDNGLMSSHSWWIFQVAKPTIIDTVLMLSLGWGNEHVSCPVSYNADQYIYFGRRWLVLATGPGNPPAVRVWTAKTGQFGSRPVQQPDLLTLGGPNPDPYPSTRGFRQVWLDLSAPISGSAFRVSHLWSPWDMILLIVKDWHWYITVHFRRISRLDEQNMHTHAPNHILKISVNRTSTERQRYLVLHLR